MKKVLIIAGLSMCLSAAHAQRTTGTSARVNSEEGSQHRSYTFKPSGAVSEITMVVSNLFADISIEGVDAADIKIETDDYEGIPEKAAGLKPLSATGPENTGIGLSLAQEGKTITISAASRNADGNYYFKVPKNMKVKVDVSTWQSGELVVKNMTNEVEVKGFSADLTFENINGPVVANTVSGDIKVIYNALNQKSPTSIVSTSGDLDITLPSSSKGNFKMASVSGEVYTDIDFTFDEEKDLKRFGGGMNANASLNGGGVEVSLKSVSGNIYIRKAK